MLANEIKYTYVSGEKFIKLSDYTFLSGNQLFVCNYDLHLRFCFRK
jgi:hypothetical protein